MTRPDALRLVALIDRLGYGTRLAEAMEADPPMFAEWYQLLEHADAELAREAVQQLNAEADFWPPRPGRIARRTAELAELRAAKIVALPDREQTRAATDEELAVARRLPALRARIRRAAGDRDMDR